MTINEFLENMRNEGFSTRCMYQAKEIGYKSKYPNIEGRTVFGPNGEFLTIMMMREFEGGVFVHFAPTTADQIEPLKDLFKARNSVFLTA